MRPARPAGYDTVVFCLANMNSLEVLERMRSFPGRLIVISALSPIYLDRVPWVAHGARRLRHGAPTPSGRLRGARGRFRARGRAARRVAEPLRRVGPGHGVPVDTPGPPWYIALIGL